MSISIGDTLRRAREELGRSVEEAARDTRVRVEYLRALENEEFGGFGGDVYAKGFLSTYARYLDLDPGPLLEQYRRHVEREDDTPQRLAAGAVTQIQAGRPPAWAAWLLIGGVVLAGIVTLGQLVGGNTPGQADGEPDVPPRPVATATPSETPGSPSPTPTPTPSPTPTPAPTGVDLVLAVEERCWMRVQVDGQVILERVIEAGETQSYQGSDEVTIRFGNPGGVRAELNGEDLGVVGEPGRPETVTFTPEGMRQQTT